MSSVRLGKFLSSNGNGSTFLVCQLILQLARIKNLDDVLRDDAIVIGSVVEVFNRIDNILP
jgi:hypothetical protein